MFNEFVGCIERGVFAFTHILVGRLIQLNIFYRIVLLYGHCKPENINKQNKWVFFLLNHLAHNLSLSEVII